MDVDSIPLPSPLQQVAPQESGRRIHGIGLICVLAALLLTLLLEALDGTIVGTALPRIVSSLQGFDRYTWAVTAYLLASVTMIPIVGKLSDQFGRKGFLIAGTTIFLLGSALAGASQTMSQLIAFRALQGLGAGMGIALINTVIGDIFPPAERAQWQGILGGVYGISSFIGPVLGGWLTDHGPLLGSLIVETTRWRWVFYLNLPLGIIALVALVVFLPANISVRSTHAVGWAAVRRIDSIGASLAAAATICLLLGLTWGSDQTYNWSSPQVISILVSAGLLYVLFLLNERFAIEPILPLNLFHNQVFTADASLSLLQGMILSGLVVYLPLFLQGVQGKSATNAGALITPLSVSVVVGALLAALVIARYKRYQLITFVGTIIMAIGIFLLTRMTISTGFLDAVISMVLAGIGIGSLFAVLTLVAQNTLPRTQLGVGTGAVNYLRQFGQTLGVAIVGTVVSNTLLGDITKRLPATVVKQLTPNVVKLATNPQLLVNTVYRDTVIETAQKAAVKNAVSHVPPGPQHERIVLSVTAQVTHQMHLLLNQVFEALKLSLSVAIQHGFVIVLVFCGAAILTTLFLKDVPIVQAAHEEADKSSIVIESREDVSGISEIPDTEYTEKKEDLKP